MRLTNRYQLIYMHWDFGMKKETKTGEKILTKFTPTGGPVQSPRPTPTIYAITFWFHPSKHSVKNVFNKLFIISSFLQIFCDVISSFNFFYLKSEFERVFLNFGSIYQLFSRPDQIKLFIYMITLVFLAVVPKKVCRNTCSCEVA